MSSAVQPNYYAIIPANVRYCKELEPSAKLLYGEITALCNQEGFCWASNKYFADLYGVEIRTIQRWIGSLHDMKFLYVHIERSGMKSTRKIYISQEMFTARQKCHEGMTKMSPRHDTNVTHNNTSNITKKTTTRELKQNFEKSKESQPVVVVSFDDEEKRKLLSGIEISARDLEAYVKEPTEVIRNVLQAYEIAKATTGIENVGAWLHKAFKNKYKPPVKIPSNKAQEKHTVDDKVEKSEANKLYARKVIKKKWSEFKIKPDEKVDCVEFSGIKLHFTDENFKEKFLKFLERLVNVA